MKLNFQALNGNEAIKILRNYLLFHLSSLNIVYPQEDKLQRKKLKDLGHQLWLDMVYLTHKAAVAYNHLAVDLGEGSGRCVCW
jgi:hypothetical protein